MKPLWLKSSSIINQHCLLDDVAYIHQSSSYHHHHHYTAIITTIIIIIIIISSVYDPCLDACDGYMAAVVSSLASE